MNNDVSKNSILWEINLKDLFWKVLYSWRFIVICWTAITVLAVGLSYSRSLIIKNENVEPQEKNTNELEQIQKELTVEELEALEEVEIVRQQLLEKEEYKQKSLLMQIDPYAADLVTIQFYIDTHYEVDLNGVFKKDKTPEIRDAFLFYLQGKSFQTDLKRLLNFNDEVQYLNELISANGSDAEFFVYIYGLNQEHAEQISESLEELINEYKKCLCETIVDFDLIIINKEHEVLIDSSLRNQRDSLDTTIVSFRKTLHALEKGLNPNQLKVYEGIFESDEVNNIEEETEVDPNQYGLTLKVVLGIILGGIVSIALVVLKYIFTGKLRNSSELNTNLGLFSFGNYFNVEKSNIIDRWLDKARFGVVKENPSEFIISNLKLSCKNKGIENICLISTVKYNKDDEERLNNIKKELENVGIKVLVGEMLLQNVNLYEQVVKSGYVVMIEKDFISTYADIEKEFMFYNEHNVNILGYIGL